MDKRITPLLSGRATENLKNPDHWAPLIKALSNPWSNANIEGTIMLGLAENTLMHSELAEHIKQHFDIDPISHFTYGHGAQGSPRLRKALANFFQDRFRPAQMPKAEEFVITSGVSAMIDHVTWAICDEGDAILFPAPLYTGFSNDLPTRSRGRLIPVSFRRDDGRLDVNDVFDAETNTQCLKRAFEEVRGKGIRVRAVMITNPHNPLGKCYPPETLKAIAAFCSKHHLHYLSDEIYANSVFVNEAYPDATPFHSVLSVDLSDTINPAQVQVLYGAAKDFCANGLRLGAFYTRNDDLRRAVTSITTFGWEAYLIQDMWARILEDRPFLDSFIAENQKRLAKHYRILTKELDDKGIPYFKGGNAGFFLWTFLWSWVHPNMLPEGQLPPSDRGGSTDASSTSDEKTKQEAAMTERCLQSGVMIGKGSNFKSEEIGWFRITFTAQQAALRQGLGRVLDGLGSMRQK